MTRRVTALLVAIGLPLVALAGRNRPVPLPGAVSAQMANAQMRQGMPLMAVNAALACLKDTPDNLECKAVLGRSASMIGNCVSALPALADVRGTASWGMPEALAEGVCRVRDVDLEGALAAFDEATRLKPDTQATWLQRGLVDARLGRVDDLDADLAAAEKTTDYQDWVGQMLGVWRAYLTTDDVDWVLWKTARDGGDNLHRNVQLHLALVDCQRWLDLGDPVRADHAARLGIAVTRGHARLLSCRGEAVRREGDPYLADQLVDRPWDKLKETPLLDTVRSRLLVDLGRYDEAEALLDALPDPAEPEALASWWYLSRARGDAAQEARYRRLYEALEPLPHRPLELLDPIAEVRP